ncbi:MAG: helix-turn-helix domain-containing protein [Actinomycetota bacterium]
MTRREVTDHDELPVRAFDATPLYVGHARWTDGLPIVTDAHRHPHPELSVAIGTATLTHDFEDVAVSGMSAVVIDAGVVHQWTITEPFELWVVGMTPGAVADQGAMVERLVAAGVVSIPDIEADDLVAMIRLAKRRFEEQPTEPGRAATFMPPFLGQLVDWAQTPDQSRAGTTATVADDLVSRFLLAVSASPRERTVARFAADLGVSAGHLSALVKERTGRTPKQVLTGRTVLEAKRLLSNTTESAAAIAAHLDFVDASQFGRFFREHTGCTPGQFRAGLHTAADAAEGAEPG